MCVCSCLCIQYNHMYHNELQISLVLQPAIFNETHFLTILYLIIIQKITPPHSSMHACLHSSCLTFKLISHGIGLYGGPAWRSLVTPVVPRVTPVAVTYHSSNSATTRAKYRCFHYSSKIIVQQINDKYVFGIY